MPLRRMNEKAKMASSLKPATRTPNKKTVKAIPKGKIPVSKPVLSNKIPRGGSTNLTLAIISLVAAVIGLFITAVGVYLEIIALIVGLIALKKIRESRIIKGRLIARIGVIISGVWVVLYIVLALLSLLGVI